MTEKTDADPAPALSVGPTRTSAAHDGGRLLREVPVLYLPEILKSGECIGSLTNQAAETLGLAEEVQVFAGAHDQYCVALGSGAVKNGDVFIATGTAWVVTGISNVPDTRFSFGRHAIDGLWGSIIALSSGGACLEWLRDSFLPEGMRDYAAINTAAAAIKAGSEGLMFYPNLYGAQYSSTLCQNRCKVWQPHQKRKEKDEWTRMV